MESEPQNENYLKNVLVLAYLGDAVFSLQVRKFLVKHHNFKANGLNKLSNSIVCAKNQANIMRELKAQLNAKELDIATRARNSHINNKAKNSTLEEYSLATQFEALIGYWYLNEDFDKLKEVFNHFVVEKL